MQLGPSIATPSSRARRASRSVVGLRRGAGLRSYARDDERPHAGCRGLLERALDALVVDHEEGALGNLRQLGDARIATEPGDLVAVRVHAPGAHPARDDGLHRGAVPRRGADDRDRAWEEK